MANPETVTLSKSDYDILLRARALVDKNWKDPKIGADFRKNAKETFPDIAIPEDTVDPVIAPVRAELEETRSQLAKALERLDTRERKETEDAQTVSMERALNAARTKYSLTDEGFDKMTARMKETANFTDAEAAAAWVASNTPPPKSANGPSWAPQNLDLYGSKTKNEDYALLHTDTEAFFDKTVMDIMNEAAA